MKELPPGHTGNLDFLVFAVCKFNWRISNVKLYIMLPSPPETPCDKLSGGTKAKAGPL